MMNHLGKRALCELLGKYRLAEGPLSESSGDHEPPLAQEGEELCAFKLSLTTTSTFRLIDHEVKMIHNGLSSLPSPYYDERHHNREKAYSAFILVLNQYESVASNVISKYLNYETLAAIALIRLNSSECTHILLENCPLNVPPSTRTPSPYGTDIPDKPDFVSEWFLIGLAHLLGTPMGYTNEKNAQVVHQIAPDLNQSTSLSSAGSKLDLPPHTEAAALGVARPDCLLLACVRPDRNHRAVTSVYPVDLAVSKLSNATRSKLEKAAFKHGQPPSFGNYQDSIQDEGSQPQSILHRTESGHYEVNVDMALTKAFDESDMGSTQAIHELGEAFNQAILRFKLKQGQLLIVNNHRALHGRNGFQCYGDGLDRWLQRVYVGRKLRDKAAATACVHDRIFDNGNLKIL